MTTRNFYHETYGCQMNSAESTRLADAFYRGGWRQSSDESRVDLIYIFTCSVRETAEKRLYGRLAYFNSLKKKGRNFILIVIGCAGQRAGRRLLEEFSGIDLIVGTYGKENLSRAIEQDKLEALLARQIIGIDGEFLFSPAYSLNSDMQAELPIMHGCDNHCSYCIVPILRGKEVSRQPESILNEIGKLPPHLKEVTLLGQNVNSYRWHEPHSGRNIDFTALLQLIISKSRFPWLRFLSSNPYHFSERLIRLIADEPRLCRHIHLPVQHGSNRVLKAMNRGYTAAQFIEIVNNIRKRMKNITITTDIMVGFDGENEDDIESLLQLMRQISFDDAYTYYYNPRPGTPATETPADEKIVKKVKLARLQKVIALQNRISGRQREKYIGAEVDILAFSAAPRTDDYLLARSEHNHMVLVKEKKERIGEMFRVRLTSLKGRTFIGEEVK